MVVVPYLDVMLGGVAKACCDVLMSDGVSE